MEPQKTTTFVPANAGTHTPGCRVEWRRKPPELP
jgi:hypothetical protein